MAENKEISLIRHPDFRCFYAIGAVGSWTSHDFRINFYSEKVDEKDGEAIVNDVQVILPPKAVRELAVALTRSIKEYERTSGKSLRDGKTAKDIDIGEVIDSQPLNGKAGMDSRKVSDKLLGPDFTKDLKKDLKKDLTKDIKQDLKRDLEKGLRQDLKKDLKDDFEKGLKQDLKKDLKQDISKGLKQDLKKDIRTELRGAMKDDRKKDGRVKTTGTRTAKVDQRKRGRPRVSGRRKTIKK
jgi:hypothetical protein